MVEFDYIAPETMDEVLEIISRLEGKASLLAGGTNLIPNLRNNKIKPELVVDISGLSDFSYIREDEEKIKIGVLTSITELTTSELLMKQAKILKEASGQFANPLVRNKATIGGNLADASPAADTAVPLIALGAKVKTIDSAYEMREIRIEELFSAPNQTLLKEDEVITEIEFPLLASDTGNIKSAYEKLGLRNAMAISVVSVAIVAKLRDERYIDEVKVALGAVAPKPIRAQKVENVLKGETLSQSLIEKSAEAVSDDINPISDIRASADYRRMMSKVLLKRALNKIDRGG
ncbi:MAG: xanthine dehydrogenase family protein subunit M [Candidatus Aerophobetes bacterium]|nr:xanthine dehydrogenase family protein subunit M [Candidatus Aerophobetes bacterium]